MASLYLRCHSERSEESQRCPSLLPSHAFQPAINWADLHNYPASASPSPGSGMLDGGSLVGKESASVLSCAFSRRCCSPVSSSVIGRSSGSRREPLCSRSFGVICGLPCLPCAMAPSLRIPFGNAPAALQYYFNFKGCYRLDAVGGVGRVSGPTPSAPGQEPPASIAATFPTS